MKALVLFGVGLALAVLASFNPGLVDLLALLVGGLLIGWSLAEMLS